MANTYIFRGDAVAVAQVSTLVASGTWSAGEKVTMTVNGKDIIVTLGATVTNAAVATALKEAWNGNAITGDATRNTTGNLITEFNEVTATVASVTVTLTADTAGKPFTVTVTDDSGTGSIAVATPTASNGPNHWTLENFNKDGVPSTDVPGAAVAADVYIEDSSVDILYDLDQSAIANAITGLNISSGYTGNIGLPQENDSGYQEYRDRYLQLPDQAGTCITNIGKGEGSGSSRILLDYGSTLVADITVEGSSSSSLEDRKAIIIKGTAVTNALEASGGEIDIAPDQDDTSIFANIKLIGDADLRASKGVDISTLLQVEDSASAEISPVAANALVTLTMTGSPSVVVKETDAGAAITTVDLLGGNLAYESAGTITTMNGGPDASVDFSNNIPGVTITTLNVEARFNLTDPDKKVTFTNAIAQGNISENDWQHDFGKGRTIHPEG